MLTLTPRRRRRVSNSLAIFGAFLLAASLLAGYGRSMQDAEQHADAHMTAPAVQTGSAADARHPATRKRAFRVNLFLFRH